MANPFYQVVNQRINPIINGSRIRDRFYHRIVNNVVKQFCLLHLEWDFTIHFSVSSVYHNMLTGLIKQMMSREQIKR